MTQITEKSGFTENRVSERNDEIKSVATAYGFDHMHHAPFDTTLLDMFPKRELVNEVSKFITKVEPEIMYLPHRNDSQSDHQMVFDAVASSTKIFRHPCIRKIRAYETLSETEFGIRPEDSGFRPNLFVNINEYLDKKIEIMKHYQGELGEHPFPRSVKNIEALATLRGATAGVRAAEAFMSLKEV
jgi:LmbE family N-acetylglucosaminyl deacetylase